MSAPSLDDDVQHFRRLLGGQLGLAFEVSRFPRLAEVLQGRVARQGGNRADYLEHLENGCSEDEWADIAGEVTVAETYFFRNHQQFEALRAILARDWRAPDRRAPRLLSAGCASGEEAYSLAIVLRESWPERAPSLLALDVNPSMLERARAGRYSPWSLRETPAETVTRWFRPAGREVVVDDVIRRSVRFAQANLATPQELLVGEPFDFIFCRNMLMYFSPERFQLAVLRLSRALAPGGYLFLGSAETLRGMSHDLHLHHTHGAFYYQRPSERQVDQPPRPRGCAELPDARVGGRQWVVDIARAAARVVSLTGAPPAAAPGHAPRAEKANGPRRVDLRHPLELLSQDQFAAALAHLRTMVVNETPDPEAMLLEAVLLVCGGNFAESESLCERLLKLDELNAGSHYVLALCHASAARPARAMHHDRVASYLDPSFAMPRLHLGLLHRGQGDHAAARIELSRARPLLEREGATRLVMFGGGFGRGALLALCDAELGRAMESA